MGEEAKGEKGDSVLTCRRHALVGLSNRFSIQCEAHAESCTGDRTPENATCRGRARRPNSSSARSAADMGWGPSAPRCSGRGGSRATLNPPGRAPMADEARRCPSGGDPGPGRLLALVCPVTKQRVGGRRGWAERSLRAGSGHTLGGRRRVSAPPARLRGGYLTPHTAPRPKWGIYPRWTAWSSRNWRGTEPRKLVNLLVSSKLVNSMCGTRRGALDGESSRQVCKAGRVEVGRLQGAEAEVWRRNALALAAWLATAAGGRSWPASRTRLRS